MENIEQVLQELVAVNLQPLESDKVQSLIKHAFEAGKAEMTVPLTGYSNLTVAIKDNEPIDWEKLDGLKVQCDNPDVGTLEGELERRGRVESDSPDGWWKGGMDYIYVNALIEAWRGEDGWTLWVEGEIPLVRKTADQLEVGKEYYRVLKNSEPDGVAPELMLRTQGHVLYLNDYTFSQNSPRHFEVVKVIGKYGTFQKPEDK